MSNTVVGLKVTTPLPQPKQPKLKYEVVMEFMFGDADRYEYKALLFKQNEEEKMIGFLNFLERCSLEYPYGKGGDDSYDHVEGYDEYVESSDFLDHWPSNWDSYGCSEFQGYEVFFYDESGVKYNVEVVKQ